MDDLVTVTMRSDVLEKIFVSHVKMDSLARAGVFSWTDEHNEMFGTDDSALIKTARYLIDELVKKEDRSPASRG